MAVEALGGGLSADRESGGWTKRLLAIGMVIGVCSNTSGCTDGSASPAEDADGQLIVPDAGLADGSLDPWARAGCQPGDGGLPPSCPPCAETSDCAVGVCVRWSPVSPVRCEIGRPCDDGVCMPVCDEHCRRSGWKCVLENEQRGTYLNEDTVPNLLCMPPTVAYPCEPCRGDADCDATMMCVRGADGDAYCLPKCSSPLCKSRCDWQRCVGDFGRCLDVTVVDEARDRPGRACVPGRRFRCDCAGGSGTFSLCREDGQEGVGVCLDGGGVECLFNP